MREEKENNLADDEALAEIIEFPNGPEESRVSHFLALADVALRDVQAA